MIAAKQLQRTLEHLILKYLRRGTVPTTSQLLQGIQHLVPVSGEPTAQYRPQQSGSLVDLVAYNKVWESFSTDLNLLYDQLYDDISRAANDANRIFSWSVSLQSAAAQLSQFLLQFNFDSTAIAQTVVSFHDNSLLDMSGYVATDVPPYGSTSTNPLVYTVTTATAGVLVCATTPVEVAVGMIAINNSAPTTLHAVTTIDGDNVTVTPPVTLTTVSTWNFYQAASLAWVGQPKTTAFLDYANGQVSLPVNPRIFANISLANATLKGVPLTGAEQPIIGNTLQNLLSDTAATPWMTQVLDSGGGTSYTLTLTLPTPQLITAGSVVLTHQQTCVMSYQLSDGTWTSAVTTSQSETPAQLVSAVRIVLTRTTGTSSGDKFLYTFGIQEISLQSQQYQQQAQVVTEVLPLNLNGHTPTSITLNAAETLPAGTTMRYGVTLLDTNNVPITTTGTATDIAYDQTLVNNIPLFFANEASQVTPITASQNSIAIPNIGAITQLSEGILNMPEPTTGTYYFNELLNHYGLSILEYCRSNSLPFTLYFVKTTETDTATNLFGYGTDAPTLGTPTLGVTVGDTSVAIVAYPTGVQCANGVYTQCADTEGTFHPLCGIGVSGSTTTVYRGGLSFDTSTLGSDPITTVQISLQVPVGYTGAGGTFRIVASNTAFSAYDSLEDCYNAIGGTTTVTPLSYYAVSTITLPPGIPLLTTTLPTAIDYSLLEDGNGIFWGEGQWELSYYEYDWNDLPSYTPGPSDWADLSSKGIQPSEVRTCYTDLARNSDANLEVSGQSFSNRCDTIRGPFSDTNTLNPSTPFTFRDRCCYRYTTNFYATAQSSIVVQGTAQSAVNLRYLTLYESLTVLTQVPANAFDTNGANSALYATLYVNGKRIVNSPQGMIIPVIAGWNTVTVYLYSALPSVTPICLGFSLTPAVYFCTNNATALGTCPDAPYPDFDVLYYSGSTLLPVANVVSLRAESAGLQGCSLFDLCWNTPILYHGRYGVELIPNANGTTSTALYFPYDATVRIASYYNTIPVTDNTANIAGAIFTATLNTSDQTITSRPRLGTCILTLS